MADWCDEISCDNCYIPGYCIKFEQLKSELERLRAIAAAAKALLDRIEVVNHDERYQAVWLIAQAFRGPYDGPQYKEQVDALRQALSVGEAPRAAEGGN